MHICVIGSGITGLATAYYLSAQPGVSVTVLEAASELGGRARVTDGAEHCTRFFMGDYHYAFQILQAIPSDAGSVMDSLRSVRRFARVPAGRWVEISHVYPSKARELSLRERWTMMNASRTSLLIAKRSADSSNIFGAAANYSLRSVLSIMRSINGSRTAFVLTGRTDKLLIDPWVRHLIDRGVTVRTASRVDRLTVDDDGVEIFLAHGQEHYDVVVVTAFVHSAYALLDRSGIPRRLDWRRHAHCKCFTIDLDPREPVLDDCTERAYTSAGLMLVVQPEEGRCIALTTTLESTTEDFVLDLVRDRLGLKFPPVRVLARDNLDLADGVFAGAYVHPISLDDAVAGTARSKRRRVYFAGSYTANSYAADSAEGACRSAFYAVKRIAASHPKDSRAWTMPSDLPPAITPAQKARRQRPQAHPNTLEHALTAAVAWRLAGAAGSLVARVSVLDLSDSHWPRSEPAIFIAAIRNKLDAIAGLLALRQLHATPRLVIVERQFSGFAGRALDSIGALPSFPRSQATLNAATAAIESGDSLAFNVRGGAREESTDAFEVAAATGAPIVPIAAPWNLNQARGRRLRPRVVVAIGPPVCSDRMNATQLHSLAHSSLRELADAARLARPKDATRFETIQ